MNTEKLKNIETRRKFQVLMSNLLGNESSSLIKNVENE